MHSIAREAYQVFIKFKNCTLLKTCSTDRSLELGTSHAINMNFCYIRNANEHTYELTKVR